MRADATKAENLVWQAVRARKLDGLKFKRQQQVGGFIVDFICFEARLIAELDGGQHSGSERDIERDRRFAEEGYLTLRFWNNEVEQNLDGVCQTIVAEARGRLEQNELSSRNDPLSCEI